MSDRVLLYGADGRTPIAVQSGADRLDMVNALLVECFGTLCNLESRLPGVETVRPANLIVHIVQALGGPERLFRRFAGLEEASRVAGGFAVAGGSFAAPAAAPAPPPPTTTADPATTNVLPFVPTGKAG